MTTIEAHQTLPGCARQLNAQVETPLPDDEVAGIAASVGRYRARWIAQGRYYQGVDQGRFTHDSASQARRGRLSGQVRRAAVAERDSVKSVIGRDQSYRLHCLSPAGGGYGQSDPVTALYCNSCSSYARAAAVFSSLNRSGMTVGPGCGFFGDSSDHSL